jgi:predicted nucleotidyltransferase
MSAKATRRREQAFEAFARRVEDALPGAVHEIILYGSTARGEATETSDVDVLVVLEETATGDQREVISRLAFEAGLEYDVAISYHIQSRDRFEDRRDAPFLKNVIRDGYFHR